MERQMDTEYFGMHLQCTREGKQECLLTVKQLLELCFAAKQGGLLKMDSMLGDKVRYSDKFLRKAVTMTIEISSSARIRKCLYNYIISSKHIAKNQFLSEIIITEAMCALSDDEDLDYIFTYLLPSYFGIEYDSEVVNVYQNYKKELLSQPG